MFTVIGSTRQDTPRDADGWTEWLPTNWSNCKTILKRHLVIIIFTITL